MRNSAKRCATRQQTDRRFTLRSGCRRFPLRPSAECRKFKARHHARSSFPLSPNLGNPDRTSQSSPHISNRCGAGSPVAKIIAFQWQSRMQRKCRFAKISDSFGKYFICTLELSFSSWYFERNVREMPSIPSGILSPDRGHNPFEHSFELR